MLAYVHTRNSPSLEVGCVWHVFMNLSVVIGGLLNMLFS